MEADCAGAETLPGSSSGRWWEVFAIRHPSLPAPRIRESSSSAWTRRRTPLWERSSNSGSFTSHLTPRPVVIKSDRAVIARPSERVAEVLG